MTIRFWLGPLLGVSLSLTACAGDGWLGGDDEVRMPGERIAVLLLEEGVQADPRLANEPIQLPPPRTNATWSQSGGTANHAPGHLATADQLSRIWTANIGRGDGSRRRLTARPVAAEGKLYTIDTSGDVRAFSLDEGERVWSYQVGSDQMGLAGGLAYENGWLFVTTGTGELVALNAATGTEIWRQDLRVPIRAAPAVVEATVIVIAADNKSYAFNAQDGEQLWQHTGFAEPAGLLGGPTPASDGRIAVIAYSSGEVFGIQADTGEVRWIEAVQRPRRTLAIDAIADIEGNPVILDGVVYVAGNGGEMVAIDSEIGQRLWDVDLTATQTPWVVGDYLYVVTTRGEVVCALRDNGRVRWVSPLQNRVDPENPNSRAIRWSGPVLAGDQLVIVGTNGSVVSMSPYTGEILGEIDLDDPMRIAPIVVDQTVLFLDQDGTIHAFR
ncbi:MAG: PQQ-binding-like beta-propeller repeat protein [Geminicoccaceae bacterium]